MIRNLVKSIVEGAVKPSEALHDGLALCHSVGNITLYDPSELAKSPSDPLPNVSTSYSRIVRASLKYRVKVANGESFNEVKSAAAKHGYGPIVYDVLLHSGWTMPDRLSVSHEALRVWKYYTNKRGDVSTKALPRIFLVSDDDEYSDDELPLINSAYHLPELHSEYSELFDAHEDFLRSLHPYHTKSSVESYLSKAGALLFGDLY